MYPFNVEISENVSFSCRSIIMEVHIDIANVSALTLKEPQRQTRQHAPTKSPTREFIQATNTLWMGLMRLGRMKKQGSCTTIGITARGWHEKAGIMHDGWE